MNKVIIFAAPSGSGKSTIINYLLRQGVDLQFSISATSRPPRGQEKDGVEYHFLSLDDFKQKIADGAFLEYCEVYPGRFYGTLKSEVDAMLAEGKNVVFDVDVVGAKNIKAEYGDKALSIFIQPPSIEALRHRLECRGTDAPEVIDDRIRRAQYELEQASDFDAIVVNDDLISAEDETLYLVEEFLHQ